MSGDDVVHDFVLRLRVVAETRLVLGWRVAGRVQRVLAEAIVQLDGAHDNVDANSGQEGNEARDENVRRSRA